ncbi:MAG: hypothetical protein KDB53_00155 [Planctomycetes bacterium]|nr:hypothetical protein [Planctomycetota bacterium]
MRTLSLLAGLVALLATDALAQGAAWSLTPTASLAAPSQRRENPGVASATHFYVFGGRSGNSGGTQMNDLWEFDGVNWTLKTANGAVGSPPARDQAAICWDEGRNKLVVFGGNSPSGLLGDTWEWDPNTNVWTELMIPGPSNRQFSSMTWNPATQDIILFGGLAAGVHLNDTWRLVSGLVWVQDFPANVPSTRRQHHLVTRPEFGDVVLCGGQDASLPAPAKWRIDVFSWNGADWVLIPTTTNAVALVANQAVYDPFRQRIVLAGGNAISGASPTGQVSEFDSLTNEWITRGPASPGAPDPVVGTISRYFAAFVPSLGKIFKVSGQTPSSTGAGPTITCEYQSSPIAETTVIGSGCSGLSGGVVTLTANNRPWLGETFSSTVSGLASSGTIVVGTAGFIPLMTPLSVVHPAGLPGCFQLSTWDQFAPLTSMGGLAEFPALIPGFPFLDGVVLYLQVLQIELTPTLALSTSNALRLKLGTK